MHSATDVTTADAIHKLGWFTVGNPKTRKGEASGWLTIVLHFAPASESGYNVCPWSTPQCRELCLNWAGRGGIFEQGTTTNAIQRARIRRTLAYFWDRNAAEDSIAAEIRYYARQALRKGLRLAVRINGTSDMPALADHLATVMPSAVFYDYTKSPAHAMRKGGNVYRTFSLAESNHVEARALLDIGVNVAAVFTTRKGRALPASYLGRPVIDGDTHDLRFLDPRDGVVVGLRAKGNRARKHVGGFVVDASNLVPA